MSVLATDMDGTFIPLDGNDDNRRDLARLTDFLTRRQIELVYVTGRHFELVLQAIESDALPMPKWMICDVGTSIYRLQATKYERMQTYADHLAEIIAGCDAETLQQLMGRVDGLRLQEAEKQGPFKVSYYCDAEEVDSCATAVNDLVKRQDLPFHVISSVDPFTGDGLIDLLPRGVTKASALQWWTTHLGHQPRRVMFAGDSGNDLAALTAGYRSIVVGNATEAIRQQVSESHSQAGWSDRLFIADRFATSGVLDGVRHFMDAPLPS